MKNTLLAVGAIASALTLTAQSAEAITCRGNAQLSGGRWITTPYCEDQNLTRVAREYGIRVSFDSIRYSLSTKERVCRAVGSDNRVRDVCRQFLYENDPLWRRR